MPTALFRSDVDGVVAGLMQGFAAWVEARWGGQDWTDNPILDVNDIVYHSNMGRSPGLQNLRDFLRTVYPDDERHTSIGYAFVEFMQIPTVYEDWVPVLPGAKEAFERIGKRCDMTFVTAIMKDAPTSYVSKFRWLSRHFPNIEVAAIPSGQKHWFQSTFAVDDRWDICQRWNRNGASAFCLRQPWNEAPEGAYTYTWEGITNTICGGFEGEF